MTRDAVKAQYEAKAIGREEYGLLLSLDESDLAILTAAYDDDPNGGQPLFLGLGFVWEHDGAKHFTKWSDEKRSEIVFRLEQIQRARIEKSYADAVSHDREKRANMAATYGYRPNRTNRQQSHTPYTARQAANMGAEDLSDLYREQEKRYKERIHRAQREREAEQRFRREAEDTINRASEELRNRNQAGGTERYDSVWQVRMCDPNYNGTPEEVKVMRSIHGPEWGQDHYDNEGRPVGFNYGKTSPPPEYDPKEYKGKFSGPTTEADFIRRYGPGSKARTDKASKPSFDPLKMEFKFTSKEFVEQLMKGLGGVDFASGPDWTELGPDEPNKEK